MMALKRWLNLTIQSGNLTHRADIFFIYSPLTKQICFKFWNDIKGKIVPCLKQWKKMLYALCVSRSLSNKPKIPFISTDVSLIKSPSEDSPMFFYSFHVVASKGTVHQWRHLLHGYIAHYTRVAPEDLQSLELLSDQSLFHNNIKIESRRYSVNIRSSDWKRKLERRKAISSTIVNNDLNNVLITVMTAFKLNQLILNMVQFFASVPLQKSTRM